VLIEPMVFADGDTCEREVAGYDFAIVADADPPFIALVRRDDGDDLTCMQGVQIFGLRLQAGATREEAQALMAELVRLQVRFEAIYKPPPPHDDPTFPNVSNSKMVALRRAA